MDEMGAIESHLRVFPLRLKPKMEIKSSLMEFVKTNKLKAAFILTCCGSVTKATLRYATTASVIPFNKVETLNGYFEVTSLVGTVCEDGAHLHITLGDKDGSTVSGHVVGDLIVQTTAEIVLGEAHSAQFNRSYDETTKYSELIITKDLTD